MLPRALLVCVHNELGIDLAGRVPHLLDQADAEWADVAVSMGCGDACPFIPGKRYLDWDLEDPRGRGGGGGAQGSSRVTRHA
jgi:arsenate reductase